MYCSRINSKFWPKEVNSDRLTSDSVIATSLCAEHAAYDNTQTDGGQKDVSWRRLNGTFCSAVLLLILVVLFCSEVWQTPSLFFLPVLELLPACRSPHRSPDWSNKPWTPRPSGHRCGPEISQTPNDKAPHHEDEPIDKQGWWWWMTMRSVACKKWGHGWKSGQRHSKMFRQRYKHATQQVIAMHSWIPWEDPNACIRDWNLNVFMKMYSKWISVP